MEDHSQKHPQSLLVTAPHEPFVAQLGQQTAGQVVGTPLCHLAPTKNVQASCAICQYSLTHSSVK